MIPPTSGQDWLVLTEGPLDEAVAREWVAGARWGAVVSFSGIVREFAEGREGITGIEYEAYSEKVLAVFSGLAGASRARWDGLGRIVIWHRIGLVLTGEASVVVAVAGEHRDEAFAGCRHAIDGLKATAPIWKREMWDGGSAWSPAATDISAVPR